MSKRTAADEEEAFPRSKISSEGEPGTPAGRTIYAKRQKLTKADKEKVRRQQEDTEFMRIAQAEGLVKADAIHRLKPRNFVEGMLVVAAVRDCSDEELTLNLPFNHTGFVARLQATEPDSAVGMLPPLSDIFHSGQLVCAVVTSNIADEKWTRIELSLRPALINAGLTFETVASNMWLPAVVMDEQEKAFTLSFGVEGLQGVLKKEEAADFACSLQPGMIVHVVVQAVISKGMVRCSTKQTEALPDTPMSLEQVKAGFLVSARVRETVKPGTQRFGDGGMHMEFCRVLTGVVHWHYRESLVGKYASAAKGHVDARVIAVVPDQPPRLHLALLPHLVKWRSAAKSLGNVPVGQRMSGEFGDYILGYGSRMTLSPTTEGAQQLPGFCPHGRLEDKSHEEEVKAPVPGERSDCRVLFHNYFDGWLVVTRRPYDLEEGTLVSVGELKPAQLISGEVIHIRPHGLLVKLSEYVVGTVTLRHLTEVPLAAVPKKFSVGMKVKCRVLSVGLQKRQVELTMKKSLLKCDFPLCTFEEVRKDMLVTGCVSCIQQCGHIVNFFGNMHGLIPLGELENVEAPVLGMTVRVRITRVFRKERRFRLSLDLSGGKSASEMPPPSRGSLVKPGELVSGLSLVSCPADGITVHFTAKSTPDLGQLEGYVPTGHLADDLALGKVRHASFAAKLEAGDKGIEIPLEAVVVKGNTERSKYEEEHKRLTWLSLKPSQILAALEGVFVDTFEQLEQRDSRFCAGYVKKVVENGVSLTVGAWKLNGFATRRQLGDHFVETPSNEFAEGQTVRVLVKRPPPEQQRENEGWRFSADLQVRSVGQEDLPLLEREAEALKQEFAAWAELQAVDEQTSLCPGAVKDATVSELKGYGALLRLNKHEGLTALVLSENIPEGTKLEQGQEVRCAILDFDPEKRIADVSLQAELLERGKKKKALEVKQGSELTVQLALHKPAYAVLWAKEPPVVVFAPPFAGRDWAEPQRVVVHAVQCAAPGGPRLVARCPRERPEKKGLRKSRHVELEVGMLVKTKIKSLEGLAAWCVSPFGKVRGLLHVTQLVDRSGELGSGGHEPMKLLRLGQVLEARVLALSDCGVLETGVKVLLPELTCRPSLMEQYEKDPYDAATVGWDTLKKGQRVLAAVREVTKTGFVVMEVAHAVTGHMAPVDLSTDRAVLKAPSKHFKPGQVYEARVVDVDRPERLLNLSLLPKTKLTEDMVVFAQLAWLGTVRGFGIAATFRLPNRKLGFAHVTELYDFWDPFPRSKLRTGEFYEVKILQASVEREEGKAEVSLRASVVYGRRLSADETRPLSVQDLQVGQKVSGYVVNAGPKGVFVALSNKLVGRVMLKRLPEKVVSAESLETLHPPGELIREAQVVSIDVEANQLELSMVAREGGPDLVSTEQFAVGDIVGCVVTSIQKYGLFVRVDNSRVSGLIHTSNISDTASVSLDSFKVGSRIARAKVLRNESGKIQLGTKTSLFEPEELVDADEDDDDDDDSEEEKTKKTEQQEEKTKKTEQQEVDGARGVKRAAERPPAKEEAEPAPWDLAAATSLDSLGERTAFHFAGFSAESDPEDEAEGEEAEVDEETKKPNKRQKAAKKKLEALEIQKKEQAQAEARWATNPTSVEDFERLLLGQGDTSIIWIRYMAFHLKMSDLEKARQVAERAVKHVGFAEAKERFNIWVAFMNLECTFGTEETADAVFRRASSHNPAKHVHLQLARIHERNKRMDKATQTYEVCGRKFGHSKKVWIAFLTFLYQQGDLEGGRKILPKALAACPKRKHPLVVSKAALLEYRHGSAERGRTVFEGLLDSYPKRTDLWSVYLDAHIGANTPPKVASPNLTEVRKLMERCCSMKLKAMKMRFFFKRWLDFEKRWGDVESQESVRTLARNFVESQAT